MSLDSLRQKIREKAHVDEHDLVSDLALNPALEKTQRESAVNFSRVLVEESRNDTGEQSLLDSFLLEFGLSNKEGVALMCLAESLLRIPDSTSADRLIAEKVSSGDWSSHLGHSDSLFVNSSTWGLLLTGKIVQLDSDIRQKPEGWVSQLTARVGEPIVRAAFMQAMKLMGQHFVLGRDIHEGLNRDSDKSLNASSYSFDMLGEAARTEEDARRYFDAYSKAIEEIGKANDKKSVYAANGISVKLSALHSRYEFSQRERVMTELLPRITKLCVQAAQYNLGLSIDAEEAARLDLSLDIFDALARDESLAGWQGLGFVLQAYQKRAPSVAEWLVELAKETDRRLMVRLVKGAYWDYEIKHAQEQGLKDYPVYTRKLHTDTCYLHCAKQLLNASAQIFPQFATHNAYTVAAILEMANSSSNKTPCDFEFQRLHGMGELLYKHLLATTSENQIFLRVYAPVGKHEDLLPYLVRRLLENGANSSFVNRFLDKKTSVEALVFDIYEQMQQASHHRHSGIPLPEDIYIAAGEPRKNSDGIDLDSALETQPVTDALKGWRAEGLEAGSIAGGEMMHGDTMPNFNPADMSAPIGSVANASDEVISDTLERASNLVDSWSSTSVLERAEKLNRMAMLLESKRLELVKLIVAEAGRTIPDALSEVREAMDFCRYYALQSEKVLAEGNDLRGCGVFLCISPWNFPLAIFVGQVAAALAAGNTVIAKPAAQTPSIAINAVQLFHEAGIPHDALHLLTGSGAKIGGRLLPDNRVSGVCFTGSTETARSINQQLANRQGAPVPLIAETGGQNCMIADSTALPEQLVDDVISSAFYSAGQRCSALRVLFIQDEIAEPVFEMLKGAMQSLRVGDPAQLSTDIGPVIDSNARQELEEHAKKMEDICKFSFTLPIDEKLDCGSFFAPRVFELDSLEQLDKEVFGPILHVIRFKSDQLDEVIREINNTGYGLTLGIHSRIQAFADYVVSRTNVGNNYINRNMIGAVVGVNPFGGAGLSGTGPKAGGPNYLYRFCQIDKEHKKSASDTNFGQLAEPASDHLKDVARQSKEAFFHLNETSSGNRAAILKDIFSKPETWDGSSAEQLSRFSDIAERIAGRMELPGPTGEENLLSVEGRGVIACLITADDEKELSNLVALTLTTGCASIVFGSETAVEQIKRLSNCLAESGLPQGTVQALPAPEFLSFLSENTVDGVVVNGSAHELQEVKNALASQEGPLIPLVEIPSKLSELTDAAVHCLLTNLVVEKTRTENLVAKGGNTQLFNIQDDNLV